MLESVYFSARAHGVYMHWFKEGELARQSGDCTANPCDPEFEFSDDAIMGYEDGFYGRPAARLDGPQA